MRSHDVLPLLAALVVGCGSPATPPPSSTPAMRSDEPPPTLEPAEPAAHPLLGSPARVELRRYAPEGVHALATADELAAAVDAIGEVHAADAEMPRTRPFAEVTYYDAAGAPIATAVFLSDADAGLFSLGTRGTRALTAEESAALRALLAEHL